MGISIGYKGRLSDPAVLPELISDLKSKARAAGWLCKTMDELMAEGRVTCSGLQGITVYPHSECEPVHLHVDAEGTFVNHTYFALLSDPKKAAMFVEALAESAALTQQVSQKAAKKEEVRGGPRVDVVQLPTGAGLAFFKEGSRYNWTKTQFAGPKVHVAVCDILRHVKDRYAPDLLVTDESRYFETGDYAKLEADLAYVDRLADLTKKAFEAAASKGPTTLDALLDQVNDDLAESKKKLH